MIICRPNDFDFCRQKSNVCQTADFKTYWSSIIFLILLQRQECSSFGRAKAGVDRGYNYHCHTCNDSFNSVDTILKTIDQLSGNAFLSWWQFQGHRDRRPHLNTRSQSVGPGPCSWNYLYSPCNWFNRSDRWPQSVPNSLRHNHVVWGN